MIYFSEEMEVLEDLRRNRQGYRRTAQYNIDNFTDANFKANFRFTKDNVKKLTKLLGKLCLGLKRF